MGAEIIPFPVARRIGFIERQAGVAANLRPAASARYIKRQLELQAITMRRKGIKEHRIVAELSDMQAALRAELELWIPCGGQPGGAA